MIEYLLLFIKHNGVSNSHKVHMYSAISSLTLLQQIASFAPEVHPC